MAKTPDEIRELQDRINDRTYMDEPHVRLMVGTINLVHDVLAQPRRKQPPEPAPSDKAERIRECIKGIKAADDAYCADRTELHLMTQLRQETWSLIAILEQDDCDD